MQFETSAPANTMILGEHAVVHGHPALVAALSPRLRIRWQTLTEKQVVIESELGSLSADWSELDPDQCPPLKWVVHALLTQRQALANTGLRLRIDSEIDPTQGLGSSAALAAALVGGLAVLTRQSLETESLFAAGLNLIHRVQGRGSGADLAASLSGGLVRFVPGQSRQQKTPQIQTLQAPLALTLVYSGYKTPTAEVLAWVETQWQPFPELLNHLYRQMGEATEAAFDALQQNRLDEFFWLVRHYQGLMHALGVNDARLSELVWQLQQRWPAAKISGSGLGDCVLGIGSQTDHNEIDPVWTLSPQGLMVTENSDQSPFLNMETHV
ncbi:MAG: GHMP kinase [Hydrogenovibrio sp.]|uniref:mevalonate kinase family protein n=1 Tax=Hydrogenovibrio sp. TaxID=2065821 RepID=UPI0028708A3A|nr:GHMP kinase [Hydrogenovibrio sp.]MDR9498484.1 GHMP kinase [Hydrogenovibrio sp.]